MSQPDRTALRTVGYIAGLAILAYLGWALRSLICSLLLAWLVAYALNPVVSKLERLRIGRTAGIVILTVAITVAGATVVFLIVPVIQEELGALFSQLPNYFSTIQKALATAWERTFHERFPSDWQTLFNRLTRNASSLKSISGLVAKPVGNIILGAFTSILNLLMWLLGVAIIPVVVFYLLRDYDRLIEGAKQIIPQARREATLGLFRDIDRTLGQLVRGQLLVALILSALYGTGLFVIGVPLAVVLGIVSGFGNIIPYFSLVIGLLPSLTLAAIHFKDWIHPLYVLLLFASVQTLDALLITPRVVGKRVGLHPLLVILALIVGGQLLGILGVLLAVPTAAVLKVIVQRIIRKRQGKLSEEGSEGGADDQG